MDDGIGYSEMQPASQPDCRESAKLIGLINLALYWGCA